MSCLLRGGLAADMLVDGQDYIVFCDAARIVASVQCSSFGRITLPAAALAALRQGHWRTWSLTLAPCVHLYRLSPHIYDRAQSDALDKHYLAQLQFLTFAVSPSPCTARLP